MTVITSPSGQKSRWTMLYNGDCPPPGPEPFAYVQSASSKVHHAAIDNYGRLFTWGLAGDSAYTGQTPVAVPSSNNYSPHPAILLDATHNEMQYPYQVGTRTDWVRVEAGEYTLMAIDEEGYLFCWGEGAYGIGGWDITDGYDLISGVWTEGGTVMLNPTLVNDVQWKDFALGWYHVLGLKQDNTVWIWGTNYSNSFGMGLADDYKTLVPIQVTGLPALPIKLLHAGYNTSIIVTLDNQVWIWGNFAHLNYAVPTQISFALPADTAIVGAQCSLTGFGILLSNGDVYCAGKYIAFQPGPSFATVNLTLVPGSHVFRELKICDEGIAALDDAGNIWGWGIGDYVVSAGDASCNIKPFQPGEQPLITAAFNPGERQWKTFSLGVSTHNAIDRTGQLFSWGSNSYSELGIGEDINAVNHKCDPVQTLTAVLDDGSPVTV